ncbi:CapA family protein [Amycolatopsis jiangsuensis]|uniref:Poly-gamma-glutamate synthesis protein (Capsule biosynthesis protein) n=1 Tax=Amycolatopsis jiangsuensis TaxID=1181879 RepID=A0A840J113_9PSEU|nr:CapA family protein [Amycolatopsis jiangsuensis]MBB4687623.1 poly-gamma-glutamate synthesis protein (capsule biosynthesis protein) [Amycolatopsis jiangsuensis]
MITLVLGGDVNLQGRTEPESAFAPLSSLLTGADVRFVNLEGPLSGSSGMDIPHKPNWRHSPPEMVTALTAAGIDVVSAANDVAYPPRAALAGLAVLDNAGIAHCGAGANLDEAHAPAVLERPGGRVAFLAYTSLCWPVGQEALEDSPGVAAAGAYTAYQPDPRVLDLPGRPAIVRTTPVPDDLARLVADVRHARTAADHVVVSMHWGLPGDELAEYQVSYAHAIVDAGADLVVGHGPHTVQAVEVHRGRPILYSLGNLVFDWPAMRGRHRDGLLAGFVLGDRPRLELIPVRRDEDNECLPLTGPEAVTALRRLAHLSARRNTHVAVGDGIGTVEGLTAG